MEGKMGGSEKLHRLGGKTGGTGYGDQPAAGTIIPSGSALDQPTLFADPQDEASAPPRSVSAVGPLSTPRPKPSGLSGSPSTPKTARSVKGPKRQAKARTSGRPAGARSGAKLTAAFVRVVRKPGKYYDVDGLFLRVSPKGRRYFEQRLTVHGRRRNFGIGPFPVIGLAEARAIALRNKVDVLGGREPARRERNTSSPAFAEAADRALEHRAHRWDNPNTRRKAEREIAVHLKPVLGSRPIGAITSRELTNILLPIHRRSSYLSKRLRAHLKYIMAWAIAHNYRSTDPLDSISTELFGDSGQGARGPAKAVAPEDVGSAMVMMFDQFRTAAHRHWFELIVFTACRSGEARLATWSDFDLDARCWTIPASRMKMRVEHRIPLSDGALDVLSRARAAALHTDYLFVNRNLEPYSGTTLVSVLRQFGAHFVPHGFRSTIHDWGLENNLSWEVCEAVLAHKLPGPYSRTKLYKERVQVMQDWGEFVLDQITKERARLADRGSGSRGPAR